MLFHLYWKLFRVFDNLRSKVNIQIWPVKMAWPCFLDVQNFPNGSIFKPWEIFIRHEKFPVIGQKPDAIAGNMTYFN